jgi:hypothetical protein
MVIVLINNPKPTRHTNPILQTTNLVNTLASSALFIAASGKLPNDNSRQIDHAIVSESHSQTIQTEALTTKFKNFSSVLNTNSINPTH